MSAISWPSQHGRAKTWKLSSQAGDGGGGRPILMTAGVEVGRGGDLRHHNGARVPISGSRGAEAHRRTRSTVMVVGEREDASEESEERSSALLVVLVRYTG
jgi:hypothetical protein